MSGMKESFLYWIEDVYEKPKADTILKEETEVFILNLAPDKIDAIPTTLQ